MAWGCKLVIGVIIHPVKDVVLCQGHNAGITDPKDLWASRGPARVEL